ncbi:MAG: hypothetical protein ABSA92_16240 [Candidatus Bathyarchaeia archaeon]|jgi:hypothetical protein
MLDLQDNERRILVGDELNSLTANLAALTLRIRSGIAGMTVHHMIPPKNTLEILHVIAPATLHLQPFSFEPEEFILDTF